MATKNTKNDTKNNPVDLDSEEQKALQALEAIRAKKQLAEAEKAAKIQSLIDQLPGYFGVPSMVEVMAILNPPKSKKKPAANGEATTRKARVAVTAEMKDGIIKALKAGSKTDALAASYGVSAQTVQKIKRDAGLTRGSTPAPTAAVVSTPAHAETPAAVA